MIAKNSPRLLCPRSYSGLWKASCHTPVVVYETPRHSVGPMSDPPNFEQSTTNSPGFPRTLVLRVAGFGFDNPSIVRLKAGGFAPVCALLDCVLLVCRGVGREGFTAVMSGVVAASAAAIAVAAFPCGTILIRPFFPR